MTDADAPMPPSAIDAERVLLGACMTTPKALDDAVERVTAEDFYRPAHGEMFAAMVTMRDAGREVDAVTLARHLGKRLLAMGGAPYLHDLYSSVPTASNSSYYAEIVSDTAVRRRLLENGQRIMQLAYKDAEDVADVVEEARNGLDAVAASTRRDVDVQEVGTATITVMRELAGEAPIVTSTGWSDVDDMFSGGLRPGTLTVIGARPSVGKSVIGGNMAMMCALSGLGSLFVSLEMTNHELICRMLANLGNVPLERLMSQKLGEHDGPDWRAIQRAQARLDGSPLGLIDTPSLGLTAIRSHARDRMRSPRGLRLIVVDYLGLIRPSDLRVPRHEQVSTISRGLKLMAKELRVPVVALHQLNRQSEMRVGKRPMLSDLRESGSIEQDADHVILLHREDEDRNDPTKGNDIELIIAKNRNGKTGSIDLAWMPKYARAGLLAH